MRAQPPHPVMKATGIMTGGISRTELAPTCGMAGFVVAKSSAVALRLKTGRICNLIAIVPLGQRS